LTATRATRRKRTTTVTIPKYVQNCKKSHFVCSTELRTEYPDPEFGQKIENIFTKKIGEKLLNCMGY
jgi:hypothetical protein